MEQSGEETTSMNQQILLYSNFLNIYRIENIKKMFE